VSTVRRNAEALLAISKELAWKQMLTKLSVCSHFMTRMQDRMLS